MGTRTIEQLMFLNHAARLGRDFQWDFPDLANIYREGKSISQLVAQFRIPERYGVQEALAVAAVKKAIRGHPGGYEVRPYDGLIKDPEELERICTEHRAEAGRWNGRRMAERSGYAVWALEETARAAYLARLPKYQTPYGVDNMGIAKVLNSEFHNGELVRDNEAVYGKLYHWRKQQGIEKPGSARSAVRQTI